jgi:ELWxxDGT repeat protein
MFKNFWVQCSLSGRLALSAFGARRKNLGRRARRVSTVLEFERLENRLAPAAALVADINTTPSSSGLTSVGPIAVGSTLFFRDSDPVHGEELWKTDGTAAGTVLVKDINPGSNSSSLGDAINVNGTLYFTADDGIHGSELWKSDGTEVGTVLVEDINPGSNSSFFGNAFNVNGTLYFTADDGVHGSELWKSDGTAAGTVLVKDINPGSNSSSFDAFNVNGTLYFTADDGVHGFELWKSDGTAAGTVLVKDINPGSNSSFFGNALNVNGALYFSADDGVHGSELWKSDGTEVGTVLVKDINPGSNSSFFGNAFNVNGTLYFTSDDGVHGSELWKSDGTEVGTVLVKDINRGYKSSYLGNLHNVNGTLYFTADYGFHGSELWKSDGTAAGTVLINTGAFSFDFFFNAVDFNGTLYFTAYDSVHGRELWKMDGTAAGSALVKDINPGSNSSYLGDAFNVNGTLYFTADDGIHGSELWKSDGTYAGTVLAADVNPGSGAGSIDTLAAVGNTLYFAANDGTHGIELWKYQPDRPATQLAISSLSSTSITAGDTVTFTVTAQDSTGAVVPSYTGTLQLTSTDGHTVWNGKSLPTSYTFVAGDRGTHTFTATLQSVGSQTITVTDQANNGLIATTNPITVSAGPFSRFLVGIPGGNALVAGNPFLVSVQAADQFGNPVTSYSGATSVTVAASPPDPQAGSSVTGALNSSGFGVFLGNLKTAGSYALTVTAGSFSGTSASLTVTPSAASYFTVSAPTAATTGTPFPVTVTAFDHFGNIATGYTGTVKLTNTDPAAASLVGSYTFTTGTGQDNGVHTFSATLRTGGSQTITVTDTSSTNPTIIGTSSPIIAGGLVVSAFTPTATGFTVAFSKPFTAADVSLYGGTTASPIRNVTLVGAANGPVPGSLVIDPSGASATFKASSIFLSTFFGSTVLPNDTWTVVLISGNGTGSAANGFFDKDNIALDGGNNGGHANYTTTFATSNGGKPTLSIPDFARGPDGASTIKVPNDSGKGIPVTLANAPAAAKDVVLTLAYNPTLFTPTGAGTGDSSGTGSTFTMGTIQSSDASHSNVDFTWHNAAGLTGTVVLGDILGNVPNSAANLYKGKELLDLSNVTVNGSAMAGLVTADGVHVNAYFGDVTGDGTIDALDVATANTVAQGRPSSPLGLSAYKLVDPAIVGDIAGDASIDATAVSSMASFTSNLHPRQIPTPPTGLTIVTGGPDPTLSLASGLESRGIVSVAVLLDHPRPEGSTGMTQAILALNYDPKVLTVSTSDITLGSITGLGSGWRLESAIDQVTGRIGINLYSTTPITSAEAGSLVDITFHILPGLSVPLTAVQLVHTVSVGGQTFTTEVADEQGQFVLGPGLDRLLIGISRHSRPQRSSRAR